MNQRSCVLIKPDGVQKKVVGKVISRFESEGLTLAAMKLLPPDRKRTEAFYAEHRGKPFFEPLLEFMTSGPIVAMVWEGEDAVAAIRKIIGATDSKQAAPGTLRNLYGTDNRRNLVHASDSEASAKRETGLLFNEAELTTGAQLKESYT